MTNKKVPGKILCLLILAVSITLIAGCTKGYKVVKRYSNEAARNVLVNRPWVDEFPSKPEQSFNAYVFLDEEVGIHNKAESSYKHLIEMFLFKSNQERITFLFPHDRKKADSSFKIEKIQKGGPFNLKLTMEKDPKMSGRNYTYFSNTDWDIKSGASLPEQLKCISNHLSLRK